MKPLLLILVGVLFASCRTEQTYFTITEDGDKSYIAGNKKYTSGELLEYLTKNKLPRNIKYVAISKRSNTQQQKIVNFLLKEEKKGNVVMTWDIPHSVAELNENDPQQKNDEDGWEDNP